MHSSSVSFILEEAKIRVSWMFFCLLVTCATCYWLSEDLFFGLATPFLKISKTSFFICTQITESLSTYIIISIIIGFFFCAPYTFYQLWCFFIPSYNKYQRHAAKKIILMSLLAFFFALITTFIWILPNIWLFLYKLSNTGSTLDNGQFFLIKLQPKIYDFSILTIQILFTAGLCSQIPIVVIYCIVYNFISIETIMKNRRACGFISILLAALITPPDVWCQLSAWFSILILVELAIFTAIVQLLYYEAEQSCRQQPSGLSSHNE